jgi:hypothetical protein
MPPAAPRRHNEARAPPNVPYHHQPHASHSQNRPLSRRARYISDESWECLKTDVYNRYIVKDQSLKIVMAEFAANYEFHGSYVAPFPCTSVHLLSKASPSALRGTSICSQRHLNLLSGASRKGPQKIATNDCEALPKTNCRKQHNF